MMIERLIILLLLVAAASASAAGNSKVFIFRPDNSATKQIGTINVSPAILIKYGLELSGSRSRFIALDSKTAKFNAKLEMNKGNATGFLIVTKEQPVLDVYINPKLMSKVRSAVNVSAKQVMAREANLGVEFTRDKGKLKISRVILN